jgi:thiamine biosynthesis lipoprotein
MRRSTDSSDSDDLRSPARRRLLRQAGQLAIAGGLLAGGGWAVLKRKQNLWQVRRERTLMQTSVAVTCLCDDVQAAGAAIEAAFARMAATAAELTRFDPASPLARLNREGRLALVPSNLQAVLREALALSALTGGAFDVTVLPVLRYFETLRGTSGIDAPARHAIEHREQLVGWHDLALDARGARLLRPGMAVTLDCIAKASRRCARWASNTA